MPRIIKRKLLFIGVLFAFLIFSITVFSNIVKAQETPPQSSLAYASPVYSDENTGNKVYIDDAAKLLDDEERAKLIDVMKELTPYTGAAFVTTDVNEDSVENYAKEKSYEIFGKGKDATVFFIDMDNREIYIFSDGKTYNLINKDKATVITDKVYGFARKGDYFECVKEAFKQETVILSGGWITQPMKYISSAIISVIIGSVICFIIIRSVHRQFVKREAAVLGSETTHMQISDINEKYKGSRKIDHDVTTGVIAGGIGGALGGGGFSGGGGSSGGGGGHRF